MQQKKNRRGREYLNDFRRDVNGSYLYQGSYRRYTGSMPYAKLRGLLWALCGGALAAIPLLRGFLPLLAACLVFGMGEAFVTSSSAALVADMCRDRRFGSAMGAFGTIFDIFFNNV